MFHKREALEWPTTNEEKTVIDLATVVGVVEKGERVTEVMLGSGHSVLLAIPYAEFVELLADRNWEIASAEEDGK